MVSFFFGGGGWGGCLFSSFLFLFSLLGFCFFLFCFVFIFQCVLGLLFFFEDGLGFSLFVLFFEPQLHVDLYCLFSVLVLVCLFACVNSLKKKIFPFFVLFCFALFLFVLFVSWVSLFFFFFFVFFFFLLFLIAFSSFSLFFGLFSSFFLFCFLFCWLSLSLFFCFYFILFFTAFWGCCFSLGTDWVIASLFCFFEPQLQENLWLLATRTCDASWWYRGHCRSGPRHLSPRSRVCAQEWHRKDIHSHIHSHPTMHTLKTKSKTLNSPNMTASFSCPLPVQCGGGRRPGSLADAPQDCSTSEAFSPRTVLTENICRCVQHILQHFPTVMPFLTTSTITFSCLASAAHQADSWWLGHVEPDDVIIPDIAGQALDIFLHGPESAHKNGIVKTFTHTYIPIHPCTLLKKEKEKKEKRRRAKCSTHQTWCFGLLVLFLSNVVVGDGKEALQILLSTAPTSKAFSPRTVLTENICRWVQQTIEHSPAIMPFLTTSTITFSWLPFTHTSIPIQPCTLIIQRAKPSTH